MNVEYEHIFWLVARDYAFLYVDENEECVNNGWKITINCNDTFYYACADCEDISPGEAKKVRAFAEKFGLSGVVAYAAFKRGNPPLKELQTKEYKYAMDELIGFEGT